MAKKTAPKPLARPASPPKPGTTRTTSADTRADQRDPENRADAIRQGERIPTLADERKAAKAFVEARPRIDVEEGEERDLGPLVRVRATRMGFVDNVRRREGDVFDVHDAEFSKKWMERVDGDEPTRVTTGQQELQRRHDLELAERMVRAAQDPLGAATTTPSAVDVRVALGGQVKAPGTDPLGAEAKSPRA